MEKKTKWFCDRLKKQKPNHVSPVVLLDQQGQCASLTPRGGWEVFHPEVEKLHPPRAGDWEVPRAQVALGLKPSVTRK